MRMTRMGPPLSVTQPQAKVRKSLGRIVADPKAGPNVPANVPAERATTPAAQTGAGASAATASPGVADLAGPSAQAQREHRFGRPAVAAGGAGAAGEGGERDGGQEGGGADGGKKQGRKPIEFTNPEPGK